MDAIKKVSLETTLGIVGRVHVEYEGGRTAYFDIRKDESGKRRIFSRPTIISQDEITAVKAVAKVDGQWKEYGYDEEVKRHRAMTEKVERGEAEYTYDRDGMISGIVPVTKKTTSNLFDTAHGLEG